MSKNFFSSALAKFAPSQTMILKFLLVIIGVSGAFVSQSTLITAATAFNKGATLRAELTFDVTPPTAPNLQAPAPNPSDYCNRQPIFYWLSSTDNIGVAGYTFSLTSDLADNGPDFTFERSFSGVLEDNHYRVWFDNGYWYLQLKNELAWGTYTWHVAAYDARDNRAQSGDRTFTLSETTCTFQCDRDSTVNQSRLIQPSGTVSTRNPALVINYPSTITPQNANIVVDGATVLQSINLTNSHTTASYTITLDTDNHQITIQPSSNYLSNKTSTPVTWAVQIKITDEHGCSYTTDSQNLTFDDGSTEPEEPDEPDKPSEQAIVPTLLTPTTDYSSTTTKVNDFSWTVCAKSTDVNSQIFYLNGKPTFTLSSSDASTADYDLTSQVTQSSTCDGTSLVYHLTLKNPDLVKTNNPLDLSDWNRWSVTAVGTNHLTASSATWRFRFFPESSVKYYWCTNEKACVSGTLANCQASGRSCYYDDKNSCEAQANLDCSTNPPQKTYHWCNNQSQCTSGSLSDCQKTGKNCYLEENVAGGNGCLQHAKDDCNEQAKYFWCSTSLTCNLGDFDTCTKSGKPCYRQEYDGQLCPNQVKTDCPATPVVTVINQTPLSGMPELPVTALEIAQSLGLSPQAVKTLETLSATVFPFFSLWLFLPLGIIIIFFPRPKGRVYHSQTSKPIANALVVVQDENRFVKAALTNKNGLYDGFKLAPGQYHLQVSQPQFIFPSQQDRPHNRSLKNFYLGEKVAVRSDFSAAITYQIPLDERTATKKDSNQQSLSLFARLRQFLYRCLNFCSLLWSLSFILVIILTLLYPIFFNLLILVIYIIGFIRRLFINLHRVNVTGRVFQSDGQPAANLQLNFQLLAFNALAATAVTNRRGYFEVYLSPIDIYSCSSTGYLFVEADGDKSRVPLDFERQKSLTFDLVIKNDPNFTL